MSVSVEQRQEVLNREVASYVHRGFQVESQSGMQAVVSQKKRIGWFWNIVLSVATGGIWLIVVVFKLINRKHERVVLSVNAAGQVQRL